MTEEATELTIPFELRVADVDGEGRKIEIYRHGKRTARLTTIGTSAETAETIREIIRGEAANSSSETFLR